MDELIAYRQELLGALESIVPGLSRIAKGVAFKEWHRKTGCEVHTPFYTLVHLWVLEAKEFALNIRRIYDEDTPVLVVFDDNAWMENHYRLKEQPRNIVRDFTQLRQQELEWLRELTPRDWSRTARHSWWGMRTMQWWVELQLECSHQHLSDLTRQLKA